MGEPAEAVGFPTQLIQRRNGRMIVAEIDNKIG
jgi:hypothetical protein